MAASRVAQRGLRRTLALSVALAAVAAACCAVGRAFAGFNGTGVVRRLAGVSARGDSDRLARLSLKATSMVLASKTETRTLEPGPLGLEVDRVSGRIKEVKEGQCKELGIEEGWTFIGADDEEYIWDDLVMLAQGSRPYDVVFAMPRPNPVAVFDTSYGTIKAEIYLDRTPSTASNFIDLSLQGFYDGIHVHRVIEGFMVQFGCPFAREMPFNLVGLGSGKPGLDGLSHRTFFNIVTGRKAFRAGGFIEDEFASEDSNQPGTIAMANSGPDSGGSQFLFNVGQNSHLDWFSPGDSRHVVFGRVIEGYELVEKMSQVQCYSEPDQMQGTNMEEGSVTGSYMEVTEVPTEAIQFRRVGIEGL